jgi:DNA-binding IclR family transcriptional regulator
VPANIKVLDKAVGVLDALGDEELPVHEIARLVGAPRSSVYRLCANLQRLELLEPGSRAGTYRLGFKLYTLGGVVRRRFDELRAASTAVLERAHLETQQTIFLCVRRDFDAVCVDRYDGQLVQVMILPVGGSVRLHMGAAPRVLLAFEDTSLWEAYVRSGPLERLTETTPTTRKRLFEELGRIRALGFAISDEDVIPGIGSIGAPIFDYTGGIRASISISGPRPMILDGNLERIRRIVIDTAQEISLGLGAARPTS